MYDQARIKVGGCPGHCTTEGPFRLHLHPNNMANVDTDATTTTNDVTTILHRK